MTHGEWKNRGVGKQLVWSVLSALRKQGHLEMRAVITEGKMPSERLFGRLGFQRVGIGPRASSNLVEVD
jgi:L-amino acid N-acyltransferase YncA